MNLQVLVVSSAWGFFQIIKVLVFTCLLFCKFNSEKLLDIIGFSK